MRKTITKLRKFWGQMCVPKSLLLLIPIIYLMRGTADLSQMWSLQRMMDGLRIGNAGSVMRYLPFVMTVIVLEPVLGFVASILLDRVIFKGTQKIRSAIADRLISCDYTALYKATPGEIITRIFRDGDTGCRLPSVVFKDFVYGGILLLLSVSMAFYANWMMALVSLIMIPLVFLLSARFSRKLGTAAKEVGKSDDRASQWYQQMLDQVPVTDGFSARAQWINKISEESDKQAATREKQIRVEAQYQPFTQIIRFMPSLLLELVGVFLVAHHKMTLGTLLLFTVVFDYVIRGMTDIPAWIANLKVAAVAVGRMQELMDLPVPCAEEADRGSISSREISQRDRQPADWVLSGQPAVSLQRIAFSYSESNFHMKDIALSIPAGSRVALVGESGSGKSTLLKMIAGLVRPDAGEARILGDDPASCDRDGLYQKMAYLLQDTFLLPGTILENLTMGRMDISKKDVLAACEKARIREWIEAMPDGFSTNLRQFASNISGGQKQRIGIARAILKKPTLWLLDEPTSSLDMDTGKEIMQELVGTLSGVTSITATHQLYDMEAYDAIYYMERGVIREHGTHRELMLQDGGYVALYRRANGEPEGRKVS